MVQCTGVLLQVFAERKTQALQFDSEQIQVVIHSKIINAHVQVNPKYMGRYDSVIEKVVEHSTK